MHVKIFTARQEYSSIETHAIVVLSSKHYLAVNTCE